MNVYGRAALAAVVASCSFAALVAGHLVGAAEAADLDKSCREETWRVRVMKGGGAPKSVQLPNYQQRTVLVCDEKVYAEIQRRMSSKPSEARSNDGA